MLRGLLEEGARRCRLVAPCRGDKGTRPLGHGWGTWFPVASSPAQPRVCPLIPAASPPQQQTVLVAVGRSRSTARAQGCPAGWESVTNPSGCSRGQRGTPWHQQDVAEPPNLSRSRMSDPGGFPPPKVSEAAGPSVPALLPPAARQFWGRCPQPCQGLSTRVQYGQCQRSRAGAGPGGCSLQHPLYSTPGA